MSEILDELFEMKDDVYRDFSASLMPTVDKERVIGVRTPNLRKYAKDIKGSEKATLFLQELPHCYYEENNLHAFLIEQIKDFDECIKALDKFLPFVDNWATCDSMTPKVLKTQPQKLIKKAKEWMSSDKTYVVRYGIGIMMKYFLGDNFDEKYLSIVANVKSDEYYIKMMIAWYFATALAKHYDVAIKYFTSPVLEPWTHNRAIQKAVESFRVSKEQKEYLKTLKIRK
jgi:3-methyladenine DNA glycosylase AlkD